MTRDEMRQALNAMQDTLEYLEYLRRTTLKNPRSSRSAAIEHAIRTLLSEWQILSKAWDTY